MNIDHNLIRDTAKTVIETEIEALERWKQSISKEFCDAIEIINNFEGSLKILGMGKSGLIGAKIVATLSSTGTPANLIHPAEAFHGDLGMISEKDLVILISNSGETEELVRLLPFLKWRKCQIISITGNSNSTISSNADINIDISVHKEACHIDLAPTSSTTLTLAVGDAIAVVLSKIKNFTKDDFARFHPGGALGQKLLLTAGEVVCKLPLPYVGLDATVPEIMISMDKGRQGLVLVGDNNLFPNGIITDGDLRRSIIENGVDNSISAMNIMNVSPMFVDDLELLSNVEKIMRNKRIKSLLVKNFKTKSFIGLIHIFDIDTNFLEFNE